MHIHQNVTFLNSKVGALVAGGRGGGDVEERVTMGALQWPLAAA